MKFKGSIFTKIVIPVVVAAIVVYLIISAWVGLRNSYPTTVTYTDVMEESVAAEGWVVRSERPVPGAGNGLIQLSRNQGEHVAKGASIAVVYQDEEYVDNQEEYLRTKYDLTALQYATWTGSPSGAALEDLMLDAMVGLRTSASTGNYSNLQEETETYRKLILRREYLVSNAAAAEMNASAGELHNKYVSLQNYQDGATDIKAADAGMFSSHLDGYETLLNPDSLVGISPEGLAEFSELVPLDNSNTLGKLVTNPVWYYAVTVPGDAADQMDPGDTVGVYFNALSKTLEMEVETVSETHRGQAVVTLRSSRDEHEAGELRQESCRLIFQSDEGLLIPKEALRVYEDEIGVFVVNGYNAWFRPVEIVAENDVCYLVKPDPTDELDERILRTGDEVILAAAELHDGKVVK